MKTKIIAFLMLVVLLFSLFSGCFDPTNTRGKEKHTHGDFVVIYRENNTCSIYDLSEEGREKEVLIIPEFIAERKITGFDTFVNSATDRSIYAPNLDRLYFLSFVPSRFAILSNKYYKTFIFYEIADDNSNFIDKRDSSTEVYVRKNEKNPYSSANVSYYYNYENSPNDGYYWIDDYDGETIMHKPENPTREGYEFAGWYKEPECITPWDFESDIVPQKQYLDDSPINKFFKYIYKETALYANWNRI